MVQTQSGAKHSEWLNFIKTCATQYHEQKRACTIPPSKPKKKRASKVVVVNNPTVSVVRKDVGVVSERP